MAYITSLEAAERANLTKRYINAMCAKGAIPGAYKKGHRWMVPEEAFAENNVVRNKKLRTFNTTGICDPQQHYMVDLSERLAQVKVLVDEGKYFTINRARQFGKTTTLHALMDYLNHDYFVVSMDFQMQMSDAKFKSENAFSLAFAKAFIASFRTNPNHEQYQKAILEFAESFAGYSESYELVELFQALSALCQAIPIPLVLMIDEVDSATSNQVFLDFLAQLRGYYINRSRFATFQSVILAGVYDIRNLKRKLRPDEEHKDNSPWNIAADFNIDMSLSSEQIAGMLKEYEADHKTGMNIKDMSQEIFGYTQGYPYLVSRICQLLDNKAKNGKARSTWAHAGIVEAVGEIVRESNSLFDDMAKKLKDYASLKELLNGILFRGQSIPYNNGTELVSVGRMFGFLTDKDGQVAISNRIFETWFYNLFIAEEAIKSSTYRAGQMSKNLFVTEYGLDMELVLRKFVEYYSDAYAEKSESFLEENGRKIFLIYIRPIINGVGNYYIESATRDLGRTDLIIDYLGKQYIIEMKIWHGQEYNARGEEQLVRYLDQYHQKIGYLLSFNFNKNKEVGVSTLHFQEHTIIEAVV